MFCNLNLKNLIKYVLAIILFGNFILSSVTLPNEIKDTLKKNYIIIDHKAVFMIEEGLNSLNAKQNSTNIIVSIISKRFFSSLISFIKINGIKCKEVYIRDRLFSFYSHFFVFDTTLILKSKQYYYTIVETGLYDHSFFSLKDISILEIFNKDFELKKIIRQSIELYIFLYENGLYNLTFQKLGILAIDNVFNIKFMLTSYIKLEKDDRNNLIIYIMLWNNKIIKSYEIKNITEANMNFIKNHFIENDLGFLYSQILTMLFSQNKFLFKDLEEFFINNRDKESIVFLKKLACHRTLNDVTIYIDNIFTAKDKVYEKDRHIYIKAGNFISKQSLDPNEEEISIEYTNNGEMSKKIAHRQLSIYINRNLINVEGLTEFEFKSLKEKIEAFIKEFGGIESSPVIFVLKNQSFSFYKFKNQTTSVIIYNLNERSGFYFQKDNIVKKLINRKGSESKELEIIIKEKIEKIIQKLYSDDEKLLNLIWEDYDISRFYTEFKLPFIFIPDIGLCTEERIFDDKENYIFSYFLLEFDIVVTYDSRIGYYRYSKPGRNKIMRLPKETNPEFTKVYIRLKLLSSSLFIRDLEPRITDRKEFIKNITDLLSIIKDVGDLEL